MTDADTIATYQSVADEYRARHGDRSVVEELVEQFLDHLDAALAERDRTNPESARVADIGCGPGWESATFADRGHEVVGVDLTPAFLRSARSEAPDAEVARMDMRSLGFPRDSFDGLWVCASFLHVPRADAAETLREFRRVLRAGGVVFLSVKAGDGETEGDGYDEDRRRFTLYRGDELRELAADAGFEVEDVSEDDWVTLLGRA
ncbi:class I SAM-dependent methyltransferase [Halorussus lipolyticus]|uniref:class I SAM-dependent methyltransferase n=1 Tax=Halorussus lipolyticus TaxID=3034024 RepID=UPI0023E8E6AC|nr:class I SAM-dependent methyltransferase [Halorussus sp. DT80]